MEFHTFSWDGRKKQEGEINPWKEADLQPNTICCCRRVCFIPSLPESNLSSSPCPPPLPLRSSVKRRCCTFNLEVSVFSSSRPGQNQDGEGHPGGGQPPLHRQAALRWVGQSESSVTRRSANQRAVWVSSVSSAAFQTEGKLYLILDFLRGGDLFTRLSKEVNAQHGLKTKYTLSRETL